MIILDVGSGMTLTIKYIQVAEVSFSTSSVACLAALYMQKLHRKNHKKASFTVFTSQCYLPGRMLHFTILYFMDAGSVVGLNAA